MSATPRDTVIQALDVAHSAIMAAGEGARSEVHDSHVTDISTKGDRAVSDALVGFFRSSGLRATLQSEESGRIDLVNDPEYLIAFDDLDGTDNFFRGNGLLPYCTVVAVLKGSHPLFHDTVAAGIIEHRTCTTWLAEAGKGITVDCAPAQYARRTRLDRRTVITLDHYAAAADVPRFTALHRDAWVKDFGSSALHLAGVSSGIFDAYVSPRQKGHEIAAGYLLIRESGGWISNFQGTPLDDMQFDFDSTYQVIACSCRQLLLEIQSRLSSLTPP